MPSRSILLLLFLTCFLCQGTGTAIAQTEPVGERHLDRKKWEALTQDLDYPLMEAQQQEERERAPASYRDWSIFFKVGAVILSVVLIAFILAQLLSGRSLFSPANRKFGQDFRIGLENIEENLPEAAIPDFLREAVRAGDYKTAVRLHYLALIQALARRELIRWEREKTNGDYLRELHAHPLFNSFREMTHVFERIWYGDRQLDEKAYRSVEARFATVDRQLQGT